MIAFQADRWIRVTGSWHSQISEHDVCWEWDKYRKMILIEIEYIFFLAFIVFDGFWLSEVKITDSWLHEAFILLVESLSIRKGIE
jgi:hypothetical protein